MRGAFLAALFVLVAWAPARATTVVVEELRLPYAAAGPDGLEAILMMPDTPGRHPLALVSPGAPRTAAERAAMKARGMLPQLKDFARHGFVAVAVLRRGYGTSGGGWAEAYGACDDPDYVAAGRAAAADLRAAVADLAERPDVAADKILAVGVSAGGFATIALTAEPPSGLVAAISFGGGRGSPTAEEVCRDDKLVAAFHHFGATSRVPMLCVYAENDRVFGPALARRLHGAFIDAGGKAELVEVPAFGEEGHFLFSHDTGQSVWGPVVDDFLQRRDFLQARPVALPRLDPPHQLGADGRRDFESYLAGAPHKAFAVSQEGSYAWRTGRISTRQAIDEAKARCQARSEQPCTIYAIDGAYAPSP